MQRLKDYIKNHKKTSLLILIVIIGLGYLLYKLVNPTESLSTYTLGEVTKGTIVSTITGTGQVEAENQLDITPKVSGVITAVRVSPGDKVTSGQTLFIIDARDAQKKVRDAELDLKSTEASINSSTEDDTLAVNKAYTALLNSSFETTPADDLTKKYTQPTISGNYVLGKEGTIKIETYASVNKGISTSISGLAEGTELIDTTNPIPLGNSGLFVSFPSGVTTGMTWNVSIPNKNASNYISNKNAYESALRTEAESKKTVSVNALTLQTKRNALADAKEALSDYYITANFSGIVASVPIKVGDQASSATTLGTIITKQQVATIPLNEVDIAKIKIGQKVNATFDAIDSLEITGKVIAVDFIGTVTSGVVNYNVKVGFDTNDDRIKPGMSTNVSVATDIAQDIIVVPTSAIKTTNGNATVLVAPKGSTVGSAGVVLETAPVSKQVTIGIADDTNTEIKEGLSEGDIIVVKTTTSTAKATATTSAPSLIGGGGGTRMGR